MLTENANSKRKSTQSYNLAPIFMIGVLVLIITLVISTLIYGLFCYYNNADGNSSAKASMLIYMFSLFFACFVVSFIIRGHSPKPAFILGGIYYIFGLIMLVISSGLASITFSGIFEKLLFSLLAISGGYIIAFAVCFLRSQRKAKRYRNRNQLRRSA